MTYEPFASRQPVACSYRKRDVSRIWRRAQPCLRDELHDRLARKNMRSTSGFGCVENAARELIERNLSFDRNQGNDRFRARSILSNRLELEECLRSQGQGSEHSRLPDGGPAATDGQSWFTASERPAHSCRVHRAMSSRRCTVDFVAGRRSTDWPPSPVCELFRVGEVGVALLLLWPVARQVSRH